MVFMGMRYVHRIRSILIMVVLVMLFNACSRQDSIRIVRVESDPAGSSQIVEALMHANAEEEILLEKGKYLLEGCSAYRFQNPIRLKGKGIGRTVIGCMDSGESAFLVFDDLHVEGISFQVRVNVNKGTIKKSEFLQGLIMKGPGVIYNNIVHGGLFIAEVSYLSIEANHVTGGYHGIQIWGSDHLSINRNHIYENDVAIVLYGPDGVEIKNNLIERNGSGISAAFEGNVSGVIITQNDFIDNDQNDIALGGFHIDWSLPTDILVERNHCYGDSGTIFLLSVPDDIVGDNPHCVLDIHYGM